MMMSPPLPPSPPSGPPRGTNISLRKLQIPFPPRPACTVIYPSSTNIVGQRSSDGSTTADEKVYPVVTREGEENLSSVIVAEEAERESGFGRNRIYADFSSAA